MFSVSLPDAETSSENYYAFRINKRCHASLAFSRVSRFVIPNLFRDPVLILSALRLMGMRPRTEALRGGSMGESRDDAAKRHPDNAPGQDPCPSRKMGPWEPVSPYFRLQRLAGLRT
jgi:hypothetical protein